MADSDKKAERKRPKLKTIALLAIVILVVVFGSLAYYLSFLLKSAQTGPHAVSTGKPSVSAVLIQQNLLSYNNNSQLLPYALFDYHSRNATSLLVSGGIYTQPVPTTVYILNWSNQCSGCINMTQFIVALNSDLYNYSVFNSSFARVQIVSASGLSSIKQNSVLIIPNGYLPDFMLSSAGASNTTMQALLNKGTSIIYIGKNFSRLISAQDVVIPDSNQPQFLNTNPVISYTQGSSYSFNKPTFTFAQGTSYGPISYESVFGGHIIAFANFMNSWPSPSKAASDIAAVIFQSFWIPQVTSGATSVAINNYSSSSSSAGLVLNSGFLTSTRQISSVLSSYEGRVVIESSNNHFSSPSGTSYTIVYFTPMYQVNGTIAIPSVLFPGQPVSSTMSVYVPGTQEVEPHIDIFNSNLTLVTSLAPFFTKSVTSNYTFLEVFNPLLGPGSYVAELNGFLGQHYGAAYFTVPGITFSLQGVNFSEGTYQFSAYAATQPVSNTTANISVNGQYKSQVSINQGSFTYSLPIGTSPPTGNLTFSINIGKQSYVYTTFYTAPSITINKQYIEFVIAVIIVILEITLVKAPTRDEFYIDVPSMPEPAKANIKLKSNELLGVFDKLNLYYHWRYMPLSNTEFRFAVSNNLRIANMPVTLTYNNIDVLLDSLTAKDLLVGIDGLYAPKAWIEQSKHDIEYLATFKKMRVYLVSNAHIFTDMDKSDVADIVTTLHNEKAFIVIYSKTSRFINKIPIQPPIKTYLAFLNAEKLEEFKLGLYMSTSGSLEELKMYVSSGNVVLVDADNPEGILT